MIDQRPDFAPIRAQLVRAMLMHKHDLGLTEAHDERKIVALVDEIAWLLLTRCGHAYQHREQEGCARFLDRYSWFLDLVQDILDGKPLPRGDA